MSQKIFMGLLKDPTGVKADRCLLIFEPATVIKGSAGYKFGVFSIDKIKDTIIFEVATSLNIFNSDIRKALSISFDCANFYDCDANSRNVLQTFSDMDLVKNLTHLLVYNPALVDSNNEPLYAFLGSADVDTNFTSLLDFINKDVKLKTSLDATNYPKNKVIKLDSYNIYGLPELILDTPEAVRNLVPLNLQSAVYFDLTDAQRVSLNTMLKETQVQEILYYCTHDMSKDNHPYKIFGLHGAPGTVKTELARCLAIYLGYPVVHIVCHSKVTLSNIIQEVLPVYDKQTGDSRLEVLDTPLCTLLELGVPFTLILDESNNASEMFLKNFSSSWTAGIITVGQRTIRFNPNIINVFLTYNPSGKMFQEESLFSRTYLYRREEKSLAEKFLYDTSLKEYSYGNTYPVIMNNQTLYKLDKKGISFVDSNYCPSVDLVPASNRQISKLPSYNIYINGTKLAKSHIKSLKSGINSVTLNQVTEPTIMDILPELHNENVSKNTITSQQYFSILTYWEGLCKLIGELHITDVSIRDSYIDGGLCHFTNRHKSKFVSDIYFYRSVSVATWYYVYNNIQDYVIRVKNFVANSSDYSLANQIADNIVSTLHSDIDKLEKILFELKTLSVSEYRNIVSAIKIGTTVLADFEPLPSSTSSDDSDDAIEFAELINDSNTAVDSTSKKTRVIKPKSSKVGDYISLKGGFSHDN